MTRRLRGAEETERAEQIVIERRPFHIDRVDFWRNVKRETPDEDIKQTYSPVPEELKQDADTQETHIFVDTHREPLPSFTLETDDRNFSRHAVVQGVRHAWQPLGHATLSRIDFRNLQREQLSITFPETQQSRYHIVIEYQDSPSLSITGVTKERSVYQAVFLARPNEPYRLAYGNAEAETVRYDTVACTGISSFRER